jgi:poly(A) polymerase
LDRIERLVAIDKENGLSAEPILRLAALMPPDSHLARAVAGRLRLSNENRDRLIDLAGAQEELMPAMPKPALRKLLYRLGKQRICDRILLHWSGDANDSSDAGWRDLLDTTSSWVKPIFPLTGGDILAAGVPEGPRVGALYSRLEEAWIESDFNEDRGLLQKRLKALAQSAAH